MALVFHLRPANDAPAALGNSPTRPERTISNRKALPSNARLCRRCMRKFHQVPICAPVPARLTPLALAIALLGLGATSDFAKASATPHQPGSATETLAESQPVITPAHVYRLANQWVPQIQRRIAEHWDAPLGDTGRGSAEVFIALSPGGQVIANDVRIITSSGSPAFDAAVIEAVIAASPLPVPSGRYFEMFRRFVFLFAP